MIALYAASLLATASGQYMNDCGLVPPAQAPLLPVPSKAYEQALQNDVPPTVAREIRVVPKAFGVPANRFTARGALSGKTVYLSPGHGFTWTGNLNAWATQRGNTHEIVEDLVSTESMHQLVVQWLQNAGAEVISVREADFNPNMVIVDNGGAGYVEAGPGGFTTSANPGWSTPTFPMNGSVEPFTTGTNRLMNASPQPTASATYTAAVPAAGFYNVYVSYNAFTARVTDAHYVVKHSGGETHFRVNQRRHGGTWVLLGRFYFKAGSQPVVQVLNDSQVAGGNISLDAVRLGGGMGVLNRGGGVSGRPRAEECARNHTQFAGAPAAVFAPNGNTPADDRNNDITARSRFTDWMHEPGEDAVYVAWHTNAFNGTAVGTNTYVYGPNPPNNTYNFTGVPGSDRLGRLIHDEMINDIRATSGWNAPTWTNRNVDTAYFGEISPSQNDEVPGTLLEIAFHDAAPDAAALKEPQFRYLVTRAIAQGVIKYFAEKDMVQPRLPPEPPTHLAALNQAGGNVLVRWRAPVVDAQGVTGQQANRYRVYSSADGLGWDDGVEVMSTTYTTMLPADGSARFFRVASVNDGGESFPSEVVGAKAPASGGPLALIVNAYSRLDSTLARYDNLASFSLGSVYRLFYGQMNDATYIARYGEAIAYAQVGFDSATSQAVTSGDVSPVSYSVISWFQGRGTTGASGPTTAEQNVLRTHAMANKPLFFTAASVARGLAGGSAADQMFLTQVLRANADGGFRSGVTPIDGGFLDGVGTMSIDNGLAGGAYDTGLSDGLTPVGTAVAVSRYSNGRTSAVAADNKLVYFGFPFETINSRTQRFDVMGRVLKYLNVTTTVLPPPDAGPELEIDAGVMPEPDAGTVTDGGSNPMPDAGVELDAGTMPMPEPEPAYVIALVPDTYGDLTKAKGGCGCNAGGPGALVVLLALLLRRKTTHTVR